jgi:hypothetical protein
VLAVPPLLLSPSLTRPITLLPLPLSLCQFDKFGEAAFGRCSRVYCEQQPLLPVGQSDQPRQTTVSLYCPRCSDIYMPKSSRHSSE